ncbi:hypothetical protein ACFL1G_05615 [Planctomycetota bacterium]
MPHTQPSMSKTATASNFEKEVKHALPGVEKRTGRKKIGDGKLVSMKAYL